MAAPREPESPSNAEQQAFLEAAMAQYGKATYNYAYRLTGNDADARDLTQDAFIRVFKAWRSFRAGTSFIAWIYRIVTNLHRDELRRRKGRYMDELPEDNAPAAFHGTRPLTVTPIEDLVESQLDGTLEKALMELSGDQRQVVILADIEERSYQEIADIMDCSIGTVRSRLHRSRALLRRILTSKERA
jgi:RNA polymerase sigma-70 factor (ECF subfamily)